MLNKELYINSAPDGTIEIALVENKILVELQQEQSENNFSVGDIFVGKIKKLSPTLNAAFVDIGHERDAFLHYTDLSPQALSVAKYAKQGLTQKLNTHLLADFEPEKDIIKTGKITEVLSKNDSILVQIVKEPISTKGHRISCELSLAGRYLVLAPFGNTVSVSKKIKENEERKRLQKITETMRPKGFSLIVRTAAENVTDQELQNDVNDLLQKWKTIADKLASAVPPEKALSEMDKTTGILRDMLNNTFTQITTNDRTLTTDIKKYIATIAQGKEKMVNTYEGKQPIFDHYGITKQIKQSFGKTVTMPSSAYLIIEATEAMHVIDVNSGPKVSSPDQENNAISVNLEAVHEIARQVRLRDLGGIIIIDFIDMKNPENKKMIYRRMQEAMENDRARHTILPLSKFGIMQITRERVRPEIIISTSETCPSCLGSGKIKPSLLTIDEIETTLSYLLKELDRKKLTLTVHPFIEAFLKKNSIFFSSKQWQWFFKHRKWVKINANANYHIREFHVTDALNGEIKI